MDDIDQKIAEALKVDREKLRENLDEPSVLEMLMQCYRGKNRWLNYLVVSDIICFMALGGWALYRFFHAETVQAMLGWSLLFLGSLIVVALGKLWAWMQINKNSIIRETKRVELQLLQLTDYLKKEE